MKKREAPLTRTLLKRVLVMFAAAAIVNCFGTESVEVPRIVLSATAIALSTGAAPFEVAVTSGTSAPVTDLSLGAIGYTGEAGWLTASLSGSTTPASMTIAVARGTLGPGTYTATVPVTSILAADSPQIVTVQFTVSPPSLLRIVTQPTSATDGLVFGTQPSVELLDASGERFTGSSAAVSVSLASGSGTLAGTTSVNAVGGLATFADLRLSPAGTYTLRFSSSGLPDVTSGTVVVQNVPCSPVIIAQPSSAVFAGTQGGPNPPGAVVSLSNGGAGSLLITGTVISYADNSTGWLVGSLSGTTLPATLTLNATTTAPAGTHDAFVDVSGSSGTSARIFVTFNVSAPQPTKLVMVQQPATTAPTGQSLTVQPAVALRDAQNFAVQTATNPVTAALAFGNGALSGTTTVSPANGVATFTDLAIAGSGSFVLLFSANGLTGVTSDTFAIAGTPAPAGVFASVAAGSGSVCARTPASSGYCWGGNSYGQLGDGTRITRHSPVPVSGNLSFTSLSAGWANACGIVSGGTVYCWGSNAWSALGNRNVLVDTTLPVQVSETISGHVTLATVDPGFFQSCGLGTSGIGYCWGRGGGLGTGTTSTRVEPEPFIDGRIYTSITSGRQHGCGLVASGDAYCWGVNSYGQVGDGTIVQRLSPVLVAGGLKFAVVSAGDTHTCGVTTSGALYCWGNGASGQLGDGTLTNHIVPNPVSSGFEFAAVASGEDHTCALTTAGAAFCWGRNSEGSLGDGTTTPRPTPVAVTGGLAFATITAGSGNTCGITTTGFTFCWGFEPGDGVSVRQSVPTRVSSPNP